MSTVMRVVTWDSCDLDDVEKPVAVWTCSANNLEETSRGYWENTRGYATDGLEEELTPEEFEDKYGLTLSDYCRPGGKFTIRGEVSWVCQAPDKRLK